MDLRFRGVGSLGRGAVRDIKRVTFLWGKKHIGPKKKTGLEEFLGRTDV